MEMKAVSEVKERDTDSTEIPPPTSLISGWNSVDLGFTFPPPHSALSPPEAVGKEDRTRFF